MLSFYGSKAFFAPLYFCLPLFLMGHAINVHSAPIRLWTYGEAWNVTNVSTAASDTGIAPQTLKDLGQVWLKIARLTIAGHQVGSELKMSIFQSDDLNAYSAILGGSQRILLSTRIISDNQNDPEALAGIIAHELGHFYPIRSGGGLFESYGSEVVADLGALDYLGAAQINECGYYRFLYRTNITNPGIDFIWNSTHPTTQKRMEMINAKLKDYECTPTSVLMKNPKRGL